MSKTTVHLYVSETVNASSNFRSTLTDHLCEMLKTTAEDINMRVFPPIGAGDGKWENGVFIFISPTTDKKLFETKELQKEFQKNLKDRLSAYSWGENTPTYYIDITRDEPDIPSAKIEILLPQDEIASVINMSMMGKFERMFRPVALEILNEGVPTEEIITHGAHIAAHARSFPANEVKDWIINLQMYIKITARYTPARRANYNDRFNRLKKVISEYNWAPEGERQPLHPTFQLRLIFPEEAF